MLETHTGSTVKHKDPWKNALTFDDPLFDRSGVSAPRFGEVFEDVFSRLCLPRPRFPTHDDRLTLLENTHVPVCLVG